MLRNGITTVQDFLTLYAQDEAYVDTSCRLMRRPASASCSRIAARDRAALDIAPLVTKDLPEEIRKRGWSAPAGNGQR